MNETYQLPDLPYDYGALEPHISAKIMARQVLNWPSLGERLAAARGVDA